MLTKRLAAGGLATTLLATTALVAVSILSPIEASASASASDSTFNHPGDLLIADQFNNRVIEVKKSGQIVWQFGHGPTDSSPNSIIDTNDAQRVGALTLMAGTGIPPNVDSFFPGGVVDNRVLLVNRAGTVVWRYGQFGVTGAGPNQLNTPVQNTALPNGDVLITDQGNERVIEVRPSETGVGGKIVWQYGDGTIGSGNDQLSNPNSAELLANGHVLIADENNNRAIEVKKTGSMGGTIVDTFSGKIHGLALSGVAFASRLANGDTLLTDSNNNRIVEVNRDHEFVWQYVTNTQPGSNANPLPTRAVRLDNGHTLISDQFNDRVIEVSPRSVIVRQFGTLNMSGYGTTSTTQGLFAPYDAKVIGDYTGLTPPGSG